MIKAPLNSGIKQHNSALSLLLMDSIDPVCVMQKPGQTSLKNNAALRQNYPVKKIMQGCP